MNIAQHLGCRKILSIFEYVLIIPTCSSLAKTRSSAEIPDRTHTTASPVYTTDVTSFGQVLRDQLKTRKTVEVPDYTLDYGYEGGDTSADEEGEDISSPIQEETSSGFNEGGGEPFGDAFDALNRLSGGDDFSGSQRR